MSSMCTENLMEESKPSIEKEEDDSQPSMAKEEDDGKSKLSTHKISFPLPRPIFPDRLTTKQFGYNQNLSEINNAINSKREEWDAFVFTIMDRLENESESSWNIKMKHCTTKTTSDGETIDLEQRKAILLKGGAAYFAYNELLRKDCTSLPSLSDMAPRTHDYDFTICVESLSGVDDIKVRDFFWTQIQKLEHILDLENSGFTKIDKYKAQKYGSMGEKTILSGPDENDASGRCEGGPSDYLALTTFSNKQTGYINYRINCFREYRINWSGETKLVPYHVVEFIFTRSHVDYDHVDSINIFPFHSPSLNMSYNIRLPDIVSLMRYTIYAMVRRGLDYNHGKWKKGRQDYARISNFIPNVQCASSQEDLVKSYRWEQTVKTFHELTEYFDHLTVQQAPNMSEDDFMSMDMRNVCDYTLREIGFTAEAEEYSNQKYVRHSSKPKQKQSGIHYDDDEYEDLQQGGGDYYDYSEEAADEEEGLVGEGPSQVQGRGDGSDAEGVEEVGNEIDDQKRG